MKISPATQRWLVPLCGAAIALSLFGTIRSCRRRPATYDRERVQDDASFAAAAVGRHLGEGTRALIVAPRYDAIPSYREQVQPFAAGLRRHRVRVVVVESVETDESGSRYPLWGRGVSGRDVLDRAAARDGIDAVVVLLHVPVFPPELIRETAGRRPRIVVALADGFQTGIRELVQDGVVSLAVVSGLPVEPGAPEPATPQEGFDRRYRSVTAENVARIRM